MLNKKQILLKNKGELNTELQNIFYEIEITKANMIAK